MTQADKDLLLKDLCERLPYGVKVKINDVMSNPLGCELIGVLGKAETVYVHLIPTSIPIEEVKPYLRPLSSKTEEDEKEYHSICDSYTNREGNKYYFNNVLTIDWYKRKHFDYRGLIVQGLALEAPEDMYN